MTTYGTILGLGCILITAHVVLQFSTPKLSMSRCMARCNQFQSLVERPKLHIIAAGSPSIEDQIAIIQDRIDCLHELPHQLTSNNGVVIQDNLKFCIVAHPAKQFKHGTQQGGRFKCGRCGVRDVMFGDLSHTLQKPWQSLQDITIAGNE